MIKYLSKTNKIQMRRNYYIKAAVHLILLSTSNSGKKKLRLKEKKKESATAIQSEPVRKNCLGFIYFSSKKILALK